MQFSYVLKCQSHSGVSKLSGPSLSCPLKDKSYDKGKCWDFDGPPLVKTSPSHAGGAGTIPGWGGMPHSQKPNIKQKQYCNKFNSDLESNWGLLHCRWILYQLSYQESSPHSPPQKKIKVK